MSSPPGMSHADLALHAFRANRIEVASREVLMALEENPGDLDVLVLASMVASQRRDLEQAESYLRQVLEVEPDHKEGLIVLSKLMAATHRPQEALSVVQHAVTVYSDDADLWVHFGMLLAGHGVFEDAVEAFRNARRLEPRNPLIVQNLARALTDSGHEAEAIEAYRDTTRLHPQNVGAWTNLARLLLMHGKFPESIEAASSALALDKLNSTANLVKGLALSENAQWGEAELHLRRAVKLNPKDGLAKAALGYWFQEEGRFEESLKIIEEAIELLPDHGFAYYNFFRAKKATEVEPEFIEGLKQRAKNPHLPIRDACYMNYALGKAHEDLKDYKSAIEFYSEGNRSAHKIWLGERPWEREEYHKGFNRTIEVFDRQKLEQLSTEGLDSELPLIIVGMMRSGTSLLEQILSSHPDIVGAGELPFWHDHEKEAFDEDGEPNGEKIRELGEQYLEDLRVLGGEAKRVTDKLPHNYAMLGLMHSALPKAKIVHVKRNPVDNCLSIFTTAYQRPPVFAHDRENIVFAYREYQRMVGHWREVLPPEQFMEVQYEEIVADREYWTRKLIEFSGLEWDDACLHHESNQRAVRTPSLWQVRQPIYKTSVERWKRFEPWIPEFLTLLDD